MRSIITWNGLLSLKGGKEIREREPKRMVVGEIGVAQTNLASTGMGEAGLGAR